MDTQLGAPQGALNAVNWARIAEHCGILAMGTIAAYLLTIIPQMDFGKNTALVAAVISGVLKLLLEQSKKQ